MKSSRKTSVNISITELKILTLLASAGKDLFGSELVHLSNGFVGRGTAYATFVRLEAKGFIKSSIVPASPAYQLNRPHYQITQSGVQAIEGFAREFGFLWKK